MALIEQEGLALTAIGQFVDQFAGTRIAVL